jgi:hypothetical protein
LANDRGEARGVHHITAEMDYLIRTGTFDAFGHSRTEQYCQFKELAQWPAIAGQVCS